MENWNKILGKKILPDVEVLGQTMTFIFYFISGRKILVLLWHQIDAELEFFFSPKNFTRCGGIGPNYDFHFLFHFWKKNFGFTLLSDGRRTGIKFFT
jgi:hypothetical protein